MSINPPGIIAPPFPSVVVGSDLRLNIANKFTTINGIINCQASGIPATITLYDSDNEPIATTKTSSDGRYSVDVPVFSADTPYTLKITKPGYLSYAIKNIIITDDMDILSTDMSQLAGDINGDGVINAEDLTILLSEFNKKPDKWKDADIDGNGIVNAVDLTYLLAGFNKSSIEWEWSSNLKYP